MQPTELVTLNMRELDRLKVIQAVVDRMLKPGLAWPLERLYLTVRQVERLVLRTKNNSRCGMSVGFEALRFLESIDRGAHKCCW